MKKMPLYLLLLLSLAACETNQEDKAAIKEQVKDDAKIVEGNAERHVTRVADNVRDQVKKTSMKLREWWLEPLPQEPKPVVKPSYCYKVMQDIVCYRQPMVGMTHQLVGYQGDYAAPPPLAQTAALPQVIDREALKEVSPAARVKTAQPVFVEIPVQPKEDENTSAIDEAVVLGNEPLPNPLLSPQL